MKKRIMRLLPVLLALVMVFGSSLTVFAEGFVANDSLYDNPYWVEFELDDGTMVGLASANPLVPFTKDGKINLRTDGVIYSFTNGVKASFSEAYFSFGISLENRLRYSSHDIFYSDGTLFFPQLLPPSPILVKVVSVTEAEKVLDQVIAILPICLVCLVGYLALRKALAVLQSLLHQA